MMHQPGHSLLFGSILFLGLGLLSFTFPEQGIHLGSQIHLQFPKLEKLFNLKTEKKDIAKIIKAFDAIDTSFKVIEHKKPEKKEIPKEEPKEEVVEKVETPPVGLVTTIQMRRSKALYSFFEALNGLKDSQNTLRVLHYGDSQIEGDRISDYLRMKLQGQFGGEGPGLISLTPISQNLISRIENGPGWERYNAFTAKDKRVPHNNFGVLAGFSRFRSYRKIYDTTKVFSTSIGIKTSYLGGSNALNFNKIKLFYGGAKRKTWCEYYEGPVLIGADSLEAGGFFNVKEYKVFNGANKRTLKFKGKDSPDFFGLSLEGDGGVMVDNIALRGSSGTFFQHINLSQLRIFYEYLNARLIILQFGGNVLPSIQNDSMAVNYGNYLRYQIGLVRKAAPNASILFIGPSDMSIKEGTDYITYPILESVRDEIKKAALESGCAFFDLYDCMGGKNSMAGWVEQKLAASDYIHFSPQGARKIATLLYSELIKEYNNYLKRIQ